MISIAVVLPTIEEGQELFCVSYSTIVHKADGETKGHFFFAEDLEDPTVNLILEKVHSLLEDPEWSGFLLILLRGEEEMAGNMLGLLETKLAGEKRLSIFIDDPGEEDLSVPLTFDIMHRASLIGSLANHKN